MKPTGGAASDLPVDLAAGSVYSVLVLDQPSGGIALRPVLDAGGPAVVPVGGVAAGAGGSAGASGGGVFAAGAAGLAAVACAGLLLTTRRLPGSRSRSVPGPGEPGVRS